MNFKSTLRKPKQTPEERRAAAAARERAKTGGTKRDLTPSNFGIVRDREMSRIADRIQQITAWHAAGCKGEKPC